MNVYLVEQDITRLCGRYMTEAVVVARDEEDALAAARDVCEAFGLACEPHHLSVSLVAEGARELGRRQYRWECRAGTVLAVGEGDDEL